MATIEWRWRSWNQKFLDYEIETVSKWYLIIILYHFLVEIKSFSITRLKPSLREERSLPLLPSWNQKFLDYEIETHQTSILRRPDQIGWNQKFLDYEIETGNSYGLGYASSRVEIKSFSITRLKPSKRYCVMISDSYVEIKSFSITRLKLK